MIMNACRAYFIIFFGVLLYSCQGKKETVVQEGKQENLISKDTARIYHWVRLLPYWYSSAQFAGYYVGIEKKIYRKHGIMLEILPFNPLSSAAALINEKKADFELFWLVNAIDIRDKGADIVNIAQLSTRSSLMLITKKSSGIAKLEDMNGKRAGVWMGFERQPQALFRKFRLNVEIIPIASTNNLFLQDAVDITTASWFDEYHSILNNGMNEDELNKFFFADYGMNFLEDGIYCLRNKMKTDPKLCRDFVEATLEAWEYVFNHPDEATEIVIRYAKAQNQPVNLSQQRWMINAYKELYLPSGSKAINTSLSEKDFNAIQDILLENQFIAAKIPYDSFYMPCLNLKENQ
jgi:NitT/TauT family transport system substrate-binding protein